MASSNSPAVNESTLASGGLAPVGEQFNATTYAAVSTSAATSTTPFGFATSAQANDLITLVNALRAAIVAAGL